MEDHDEANAPDQDAPEPQAPRQDDAPTAEVPVVAGPAGDDDATVDAVPTLAPEPTASDDRAKPERRRRSMFDEPSPPAERASDPAHPEAGRPEFGPATQDRANGVQGSASGVPGSGRTDLGDAAVAHGPADPGLPEHGPASYGPLDTGSVGPTGFGEAPGPEYGPAAYAEPGVTPQEFGPAGPYGSPPVYGPQVPLHGEGAAHVFDQTQTADAYRLPPDTSPVQLAEPPFPYLEPPGPDPAPLAPPPWPAADEEPVPRPPTQVGPPSRGPLLAPSAPRRSSTRKGRRVKRVVRRIELWSVLKVSMLFYFCMYVAVLTAGVLLWGFAHSAGLIENYESFMRDIGFDDFRFFGDQLFREAAIVGAVLVVAGSVITVLAVALVNLISEVTGGIRFVVIEIDADERPSAPPR